MRGKAQSSCSRKIFQNPKSSKVSSAYLFFHALFSRPDMVENNQSTDKNFEEIDKGKFTKQLLWQNLLILFLQLFHSGALFSRPVSSPHG